MSIHWEAAIDYVKNNVFLVVTPHGRGTAFLVHSRPGSDRPCVVTAFHVIKHEYDWGEPIKLIHIPTGKEFLLTTEHRIIAPSPDRDQALIEILSVDFPILSPLDFVTTGAVLKDGSEVGWVGYPSIAPSNLCFFYGHVSSWLSSAEAYLVDGVAIHGVSGGPAFTFLNPGMPTFIGLVTEYHPNVSTGSPWPGLSLVRSINPLSRLYDHLGKALDLAKIQDLSKSVK